MKPGEPDLGFPLRWEDLADGGPGCFVPDDPDEILARTTEEEFRTGDERMPYFAAIWPSGQAMAKEILDGADLRGVRILDLGCGVGAVGIASAWKGADVAFLDWEPRALALVEASLARQGLTGERVVADWRSPPPLGPFDRIVAADVLYEARNLEPVVALAAALLAPGGEAWVGDPDRIHARDVVARFSAAGLRLLEEKALAAGGFPGRVRRFRFARR